MTTGAGRTPPLVDAHAHLDEYPDTWLGAVLDQLQEQRIATITVAMAPQSFERALQIEKLSPFVVATMGIHPWNAHHFVTMLDELEELLQASPMFGEIGLDFHNVRDTSLYDSQERVFEFFLDAARQQDKIVNVHTSGAEEEVVELLQRYDVRRSIIHWYAGPPGPLRRMIDRGCYFTFGCELLQSEAIQSIAREVPVERVLTETDNPGGPQWVFGEPAMPDLVGSVLEGLAVIYGRDTADMAGQVRRNALELAGSDVRLERFRHALAD